MSIAAVHAIHVRFVTLAASADLESRFAQALSASELERAARFANPTLRRRFTLARGVLRHLLARDLATRPSAIVFGYEPAGKPFLQHPAAPLQFNMSHADDMAAYAFSRDCRVGIDIERLRPMPDLESIAKLFFTPEEHAALEDLPEPARTKAFFRSWTRKEAYVKATGQGLSMPLHSIPAGLLTTGAAPPWQIRDLSQDQFTGAIAFDSPLHGIYRHPLQSAAEIA